MATAFHPLRIGGLRERPAGRNLPFARMMRIQLSPCAKQWPVRHHTTVYTCHTLPLVLRCHGPRSPGQSVAPHPCVGERRGCVRAPSASGLAPWQWPRSTLAKRRTKARRPGALAHPRLPPLAVASPEVSKPRRQTAPNPKSAPRRLQSLWPVGTDASPAMPPSVPPPHLTLSAPAILYAQGPAGLHLPPGQCIRCARSG